MLNKCYTVRKIIIPAILTKKKCFGEIDKVLFLPPF